MKAPSLKAIVVVFVLFIFGLGTTGCGKQKTAWVNTNSMPGHTFTDNSQEKAPVSTTIVYLGSDRTSQRGPAFGPKDVNFEFKNLK